MLTLQKNINALIIYTIAGILLGAFGVQFIGHETPCPLCLLQRIGMISVAASLALNIKFGIRAFHYGLALLSSFFGGFVALRQISLHVCPGFPEFGLPVLGISLYTWSFFVFVCCVLAVALLLFLYNDREIPEIETELTVNRFQSIAFWLIFLVAFLNVISTFAQCGLGVCE
jgi:disulfide bond formation protein DsbB